MAKLFPIGIEVEEVAVGSVLRILNKTPGVAKLHLNLMNESATISQEEEPTQEIQNVLPPVRRAKDGSSQMVVAEVLKLTPSHNNILKEALKRSGYSESSLPSLITKMGGLGFIKKVGVGTWRLTDKGSRHYFGTGIKTKQLSPRRTTNGPITNNGYGVRRLVLTSLNSGAQLLAKDLRRILEENDYSPKNMTGTVSKMKQEGLVKSDDGVYSLTSQGVATLNEVAASPMENQIES